MKSNNIEKVLITSGVDGGRGWVGDVKNMPLDSARMHWFAIDKLSLELVLTHVYFQLSRVSA
jgi:hypothetical protein